MQRYDLISVLDRHKHSGKLSKRAFQRTILTFYAKHGRAFPWRSTRDPYKILVSEVMLQQTQTQRVAEKFPLFVERFPTVQALARAPLREVLRAWEGMGYYRRARNLHRAAMIVCERYEGQIPQDGERLLALPGIGSYTAAAVQAFAFNKATAMVETNIRSLFIYLFFRNRRTVSDQEILARVQETMPAKGARQWFYALMDAGVEVKKSNPRINKRSKHYARQTPFEGSDRQLAARVLRRAINSHRSLSIQLLERELSVPADRLARALKRLTNEGLLERAGKAKVRSAR